MKGPALQAPPAGLSANLGRLDRELCDRFSQYSETAALDSKVLLAFILKQPKSWVVAHPEYTLEPHEMASLSEAVTRLDRATPLPYVLGAWEFYGHTFKISPAVLIPRPETELLVERAVRWLERRPDRRRAADIGTGCGCIAVSLAKSIPDLQVIATDISFASLEIAQENIHRHHASGRIKLVQSDLLNSLEERLDLICANLPYIPSETLRSLPVAAHEPWTALDGGPDGMAVINRLMESLSASILPGGLVLLEIEARQGQIALDSARSFFPGAAVGLSQDLAGLDRLISIHIPD
ncbi:MAG: peptide chain release factor N(5)-glutamine methyltransferase [Anaerolineales bacterium]|nr:peptide chain release factor N(5)-glutamine methyltransferase [Anaerolineales bacterium]